MTQGTVKPIVVVYTGLCLRSREQTNNMYTMPISIPAVRRYDFTFQAVFIGIVTLKILAQLLFLRVLGIYEGSCNKAFLSTCQKVD